MKVSLLTQPKTIVCSLQVSETRKKKIPQCIGKSSKNLLKVTLSLLVASFSLFLTSPASAQLTQLVGPTYNSTTIFVGEGRGISFRANQDFCISEVEIYSSLVNQSFDVLIWSSTDGNQLNNVIASNSAVVGGNAAQAWVGIPINFCFTAGEYYAIHWRPSVSNNQWASNGPGLDYFEDADLPSVAGPVTLIMGFEGFLGESFNNILHPRLRVDVSALENPVDCDCLDNESSGGPVGQFLGQFRISSSPGETWEISNPSNVYDYLIVNPAPPVALQSGDQLNEANVNGLLSYYFLDFLHLDGENYSFRIQNQANPAIGFDITGPTAGCAYPNAVIDGDDFVCPGATETYSVVDIPQASYQWTLTGGGVFNSPTNVHEVWVDWGDVDGGPHTLEVTVTTIHDCEEIVTLDVIIEDVLALACNNNINLSMDANCEVQLTPDMILEDPQYEDDSYTIELLDIQADTIVPNGIINGNYVGVLLQVKVIQDCSGNSCWGYITVEDKTVPDLECEDVTIHCSEDTSPFNTGLPLPQGTNYYYNGDDFWTVLDFDACGASILTFYDNVTNLNCVGPYAAQIIRTWKLTDGSGSMTTCTQTIYTELASLAELQLPPNYDGTQEDPLNCADKDEPGGWISLPPTPDGHEYPSPESTGSPQGPTCLNLVVDYNDQFIEKCGDFSFTIVRRWTIWDICTNQYREHNQNIKVLDLEGPVCVAPNEFDVYTKPGECTVNIEVPPPTVIFDCSNVTYTVKYKLRDDSGNPFLFPISDGVVYTGGEYTIMDIPFTTDSVWIIYFLIDDCGNETQCFTEAAIHDIEEPVAVCDLHTTVSVGEDGCGYANVWSFDDGSWDNCYLDYMEARRMEDFSCDVVNGWAQTVKFCCEDIGNTVMVQLRVFDVFGNYNSCMVEVEVQDNIPPELISCPLDVTVDCGTDLSGDLSQYGMPEIIDNCDVTISETPALDINNCGTGELIRTFVGKDPSNNMVMCEQTIYIREFDPFWIDANNPNNPNDDVIWPNDVTVYGCVDTGTEPDDLPNGAMRPIVFETECSLVAMDYEDLVFQVVDDACFKVLRRWTVIDWCQFDQFNPGAGGIWYYTQVIKVQNQNPPIFSMGCDDVTINGTPVDGCLASIELTAWADDDCTAENDLEWYYEVYLDNNEIADYSGNSNNASRTYPFGRHKVTWWVTDQCGNVSMCMQFVTITDIKPPTPICLGELVTVVMESNGSVTIWAADFLKEALDNCSDESEIDVSFSESLNDIFRTFTCAEIEGGVVDTFELQIWLTDQAGNKDYCTVQLIVQDNSNACPNAGSGFVDVSGAIYTENQHMVEGVEVMLDAELDEFPISQMNDEGYYAFSNLFMYENYQVEPWRDDSPLLGVSSLDLVLMQKHILGITALDSPYKIIAADVNNSSYVSSVDIVQLRKLILGLIEELPANDSWRFVDATFEFDDPLSPFPFVESIQLDQIYQDVTAADFIAVKIGDVNETVEEWDNSGIVIRQEAKTEFLVENQDFQKGENVTLGLKTSEAISLLGFQFSFEFDPTLLSFVGFESHTLDLRDDNLGLQDLDSGLIHVSFSKAELVALSVEDVVLLLHFKANQYGKVASAVHMNEGFISPELYVQNNKNIETKSLNIEFRDKNGSVISQDDFVLYQNVPNPFENQTVIGFKLPKAQQASLKLFDVTGRLIQDITQEYAQGYNEVVINMTKLNYTGILYYQLETETHSANKKMIIIK